MKSAEMTFKAESNMARIGRDPEYADMDNPPGYIFGEVWSVSARSDYGEVYYYRGQVRDEAHAHLLAKIFSARQNRGVPCCYGSDWVFNRYSYGSQAYIDNEVEIVAQERFEDEHPY